MRKHLQRTLITGLFMLGLSIPAFAGQWKEETSGWWYDNGDGSYPVHCWKWIDGNHDGNAECYYFDTDGFCLTNTLTPDGYAVDEKGAWIVDGVVQVTQISKYIELSDYLDEGNVFNAANDIGGMVVTQSNKFKQCAVGDKLTIGILADSISEYTLRPHVYTTITDIINDGNQKVTFFNVLIGDDFEIVRNKLNHWNYALETDVTKNGDSRYDFWCSDASTFRATFRNNILISYCYEVRYTE